MMEVHQENLQAYIDYMPTPEIGKRMLWDFFFLCSVATIPTALLGAYARETRAILLPIYVLLWMWSLCLAKDMSQNKKNIPLFLGSQLTFFSLVLLIASYKILATRGPIPTISVASLAGIYAVGILLCMVILHRRIHAGYYLSKKPKPLPPLVLALLALCTPIIGVVIHRTQGSAHRHEIQFHPIMGVMMLAVSFLITLGGISQLVKYRLMRRLAAVHSVDE